MNERGVLVQRKLAFMLARQLTGRYLLRTAVAAVQSLRIFCYPEKKEAMLPDDMEAVRD